MLDAVLSCSKKEWERQIVWDKSYDDTWGASHFIYFDSGESTGQDVPADSRHVNQNRRNGRCKHDHDAVASIVHTYIYIQSQPDTLVCVPAVKQIKWIKSLASTHSKHQERFFFCSRSLLSFAHTSNSSFTTIISFSKSIILCRHWNRFRRFRVAHSRCRNPGFIRFSGKNRNSV